VLGLPGIHTIYYTQTPPTKQTEKKAGAARLADKRGAGAVFRFASFL